MKAYLVLLCLISASCASEINFNFNGMIPATTCCEDMCNVVEGEYMVVDAPGFRTRSAFATAVHPQSSNQFFAFGGAPRDFTQENVFFNDLWLFADTSASDCEPTGSWTELTTYGSVPTGRAYASISTLEDLSGGAKLFVIGGSQFGSQAVNAVTDHFYSYDITSQTWTDLSHLPGGPGPISGIASTAPSGGTKIFTFGGINNFFQTNNQIFVFDLVTNEWSQLDTGNESSSAGPGPSHTSFVDVYGGKIIQYGGEGLDLNTFAFSIISEVWEYDLAVQRWRLIASINEDLNANYNSPRLHNGKLVYYGGDQEGGCEGDAPFVQNPSDKLVQVDLLTGAVSVVQPTSSVRPPAKKEIQNVVLGNFLYIFGGFGFTCEDGQSFGSNIWRVRL